MRSRQALATLPRLLRAAYRQSGLAELDARTPVGDPTSSTGTTRSRRYPPRCAAAPYVYTFHAPVYREVLSERQGSYRLPASSNAAWCGREADGVVKRS